MTVQYATTTKGKSERRCRNATVLVESKISIDNSTNSRNVHNEVEVTLIRETAMKATALTDVRDGAKVCR